MQTYKEYGKKMDRRLSLVLEDEGLKGIPTKYEDFMKLDNPLRKQIAHTMPQIMSDNYEHFMACLPGKKYAGHHLLIRKQIGGFTVACGYWKWLEMLSHKLTRDKLELIADLFKGKHNKFPRQFNKDFWLRVIDEYDGYMPIRIEYLGEGAVITGVPFPIAQIYGEKPAVWVNEPVYIQIGHLSHVATIAAQIAEILGDPWRFIEVAFRAMQGIDGSDDLLIAMLIGGGIISTSNDFGAFINGAPFKCSGTTGHCFYQQYKRLIEALRVLLGCELGKYSTVLLDINKHEHGFKELQQVLSEGYDPPFGERPDSDDTLKLGMHDLTVLQDEGVNINVVFEDGYKTIDILLAEKTRKQLGLDEERALFGGGSLFLGQRRALEAAYKACYFHDGTVENPINIVDTMKICLGDLMKQSVPGMIDWFQNEKTGVYMLGVKGENAPVGYQRMGMILYDGLTNPGKPFFNPAYCPQNLAACDAVRLGQEASKNTRRLLGPDFTRVIGEDRSAIAMTAQLKQKRKTIYEGALEIVAEA